MQQESEAAGASLTRTGAYIAADRLSQRPAAHKAPSDCVVLIVEDDPDQLALADLRVSMAGYKVRVAQSVNAFLHSMLDEGAPDLLLLDVAAAGRQRLRSAGEDAPASGARLAAGRHAHRESDAADIGKGLLLGADGYITKPYTKNILADVIRRVLKHDGAW